MLMFSSNTLWNIPRVTCIFSVYTWAFSRVCIPRKYKWLVGHSVVYHEKGLHNYLIPKWPARHNGELGCDTVELHWSMRRFGGFILINLQRLSYIPIGCIFYGIWYRRKLTTSCLIEMSKLSHNYYFNYSSWECFFFAKYSQGDATPCLLRYVHLLTQEASSAEQLQACYFLKVN